MYTNNTYTVWSYTLNCCCGCWSNSLICCSVMASVPTLFYSISLQREGALYFCQGNKKLFFFCCSCWLEITRRIFPRLPHVFGIAPCSSPTGKWQQKNIEPDNRLWQCCFSEVSVTLQRIAPESGKSNQAVPLPGAKSPSTTEWFIQILWSDWVPFQLLWDWRQTEEIRTMKSEARRSLYTGII